MDLETARFLLSDQARRLAHEIAAADPRTPADELALATRLRSAFPPDGVAAAMTQFDLRRRAVEKLGPDAAAMLLTPDGLEQATNRLVATHRAERLSRASPARVVDLTCGIGADLLAIARAGCAVVGVDRDPATALIASANLAALGIPLQVTAADAENYPLAPDDVCFLDPARRDGSGRVFDLERLSPPWRFVEAMLDRDAVVKLAPGLSHSMVPAAAEAEWVSLDGRLREAVVWSGRLTDSTRRRASVLTSTVVPSSSGPPTASGSSREVRVAQLTDADLPADDLSRVRASEVAPIGRYLYEPDDAVVRANLVAAFAVRVSGWLVDPHIAYVASDQAVDDPLGRGYEVLEVLPYREKALRGALRARDIGVLTIKKRGVQVVPERLRERLRLTGSRHATLILTRTPRSAQALLVDPLDERPAGSGR